MAVTTTKTNKPLNPRGNDQSPKGYNRAELYTGKALDFDGSNDNLTTQYAPSSNIQTTAYWVKLNASQNQHLGGFILGTTNQYGLYYWGGESNKNFGFNTWASDSYGITLPDFVDDWFHIVAEYNFTDFTQGKIYINGQDVGTLSQTRGTTQQRSTTGRVFEIGTPSDAELFGGQINGIKIFEGSLTAAQVADLYNNPEKIVPTGAADSALKLWLPMQEGAGTTAYDGSGNGNHGTISGATYVNGVGAPVSQTAVIDWNKGQNYVEHSEEIDDAYYTKTNATITADDVTAPDGQSTADKVNITSDSQSGVRAYKQINAAEYTMSFYAKAGTQTDIEFYVIQQGVAEYTIDIDLINGTLSNVPAGISDSSITDAGNGWWRITATRTFTAAASNHGYGAVVSSGNGTNFYLWGFQHIQASSVGPYIPTFGTAQTSDVLLPQGLTTGRDITGVNLFENVRKQGALNLDGNSWAEVHDNASTDMTQAISVEAWVYWDSGSTGYGILGKWSSYLMYISTNSAEFYINGAKESNNYTITTAGWYHLVGTYDKANQKLYVNGTLIDSSAKTADITTQAKPLEIGRFNQGTGSQYIDQIAQPRIYNRALTAEEVQRNYDAGKNIYK